MIPDIVIPADQQADFIIASLIRQEAMLMNISEGVNVLVAQVESRSLVNQQDASDAEYVKKLKELARKLNDLYSKKG